MDPLQALLSRIIKRLQASDCEKEALQADLARIAGPSEPRTLDELEEDADAGFAEMTGEAGDTHYGPVMHPAEGGDDGEATETK